MEEKERYIIDRFDEDIFDIKKEYYPSNQTICDTLNQQYKRIKELENMNARLSQGIYWGNGEHFCDVVKRYKAENHQLKQQIEESKEENKKLKKLLNNKILLAEDGSVDVDKLEQDGFYVIIYRQGAKPPMWLTHQHEAKGDEVV